MWLLPRLCEYVRELKEQTASRLCLNNHAKYLSALVLPQQLLVCPCNHDKVVQRMWSTALSHESSRSWQFDTQCF
jgi:hypothetical protein